MRPKCRIMRVGPKRLPPKARRMATRKRKGMWIKNSNPRPVEFEMKTRRIKLAPGEEQLITAEEVLDPTLRAQLQIRAITIVRPAAEGEEEELVKSLGGQAASDG